MSMIPYEISWWDLRICHPTFELFWLNQTNPMTSNRSDRWATRHVIISTLRLIRPSVPRTATDKRRGSSPQSARFRFLYPFLFWFWFSKDKGGLWKCCIRRDAAFCHECTWKHVNATIPWTGHFLGSVALLYCAPFQRCLRCLQFLERVIFLVLLHSKTVNLSKDV